ncbi:LamG-like jellyroll fold domain-containing protein [Streptomyces bobili]|uniref:LamG-like jellyroll fold domain-containing protein n=1 Tax=Streptomyces bobili TaxID=67280 RepID=UPI003829B57D
MTTDFLDILGEGLTPAYDRGLERLTLQLLPHTDGTLHAQYSFQTYLDRYGRLPDAPRYLLTPQRENTEPLVVRVWFTRSPGQAEEPVDVQIPAGWPAGQSMAVELPGRATELIHHVTLTRVQPLGPAPQSAADWQFTALLGNLAKLLWVIGRDYEELTWRLGEVALQRYAHSARGASLDLLGHDLGAPRFPPRPYTWDDQTVALYHLDDRRPPAEPSAAPGAEPEVVSVADAGMRFGAFGHAGTNDGAHSGRTGRFSAAFEFAGPGSISVDDNRDFEVGPDASLTVEAVVRPNRTVKQTGAVVAKCSLLSSADAPGWSLTVGRFRALDRNLRLSVSDGTTIVELFADRALGDGVFHHVAAVVERLPQAADPGESPAPRPTVVRLYVDGVEVARRLERLGALSNDKPLVLGLGRESQASETADAQYAGLLEEVRISRTARTSFEPVTGEGDDHYRMRLQIFQRWLVPGPDALQAALNAALNEAGPIAQHEAPLEIDEAADRPATGSLALRVLPHPLTQGQSVAADGNQRISEAESVGTPEDEPDFDPEWLCRHDDRDGLDFGTNENNRRMQLSIRLALETLVDRLGAQRGTLRVLRSYDETATDLHRVGRALLLDHDSLQAGELGVHAHAAGFGWVQRTRDGLVHVAQPPGPAFHIVVTPPDAEVRAGDDLALGLEPSPDRLAGAEVHWSVTRCGLGDAKVSQGVPAVLHPRTAGELTVQVEVTRAGHTRGGHRVLRIGLAAGGLGIGESISRAGVPAVTEAQAAGPLTKDFDERYLHLRTDDLPGTDRSVDYGTDLDNRRMQRVTALALDRLLGLIDGEAGRLSVTGAYNPADTGLRSQGRALVLRHSVLSAGELSARAFDAGFDFVKVALDDPPTAPSAAHVEVAVAAGEQIAVSGPSEIAVGEVATATAVPHPAPADACFAPDGAHAYVSEPGSHQITSFTVAASPRAGFPRLTLDRSTPVAPFPGPLSFTDGRLYVAHQLSDSVSVLDPDTLVPAVPALTGPQPVALGTDGARLFVAYAGDHRLRAYNPQDQEETGSVELPGVPRAIAASPNSPVLAVLLDGGRFCLVIRAGLQLQGDAISTGPGSEALTAAFTPDGTKLYVARATQATAGGKGSVQVYPRGARTPSATLDGFPAATLPLTLRAAPGGRHLYLATVGSDSAAGRVHVIDTSTDVLLPLAFSPGGDCRALAVSPAAAPFRPCLLAAAERSASVLLADPAPLGRTPPLPPQLASRQPLSPGGGQELSWSVTTSGHGRVTSASLDSPVNRIEGSAPGVVLVRAEYLPSGGLWPYQCEVRLNRELDGTEVKISKDCYDLVLNILNWFHPIGVEFRTERLRRHVLELSDDSVDANLLPAYTFPNYHRSDQLHSRFIRPDKDDER